MCLSSRYHRSSTNNPHLFLPRLNQHPPHLSDRDCPWPPTGLECPISLITS
ncbi:hypothetical protein BDV24DRAFT_64751 [Aspergillus arachidicola]|uniref:Uncharacterized protein n=1 Tax=Aspergillus arachidicola TaxID=656916 RepID=A0A5N6Y6W7_9EURO|nr:hypothetical protein BDV24DRAFT_64751 [Aspergillus arachidicola]